MAQEKVWGIKCQDRSPPCPKCNAILKLNVFDRRYECHCGLTYYKSLSGVLGLRQGWYNGQEALAEALKEAGGD